MKPGSQGGLWRFFRPDGSRQAGGGVGGEEGEGHSSSSCEPLEAGGGGENRVDSHWSRLANGTCSLCLQELKREAACLFGRQFFSVWCGLSIVQDSGELGGVNENSPCH